MPNPQFGSRYDLATKFGLVTGTEGSGDSKRRPSKKRRHQRQARIYPIQLEPLEQRQLLSTSVTQDLFAVPPGTAFNSTNLPWWTTINPDTNSNTTSMIADDQLLVTLPDKENSNSPNTLYLATGSTGVNGTAGTANSVQQATFSAMGEYSQFGLVARAGSSGSNYYYYGAETDGSFGDGGNAHLIIFSAVYNTTTNNTTQTTIGSVALPTLGPLNLGTEYNLKFLVQSPNSTTTELEADLWQQGTADPGWQLHTTDATGRFNGGSNSTGYDGIFSNPVEDGPSEITSYISNYEESYTPNGVLPTDMPEINSFTTTPTTYSSTYPATFDFNASITSPQNYYNSTNVLVPESITSYSLSFGDPGSTTLNVTSSSFAPVFHTYTSAPADAYTATLTVTDTSGGTTTESIEVDANTSPTTDSPTGTLTINRNGGNGIGVNNSLLVDFTSSGTPYSSSGYSIASYTLNFGDGDVVNMPIPSGSSTSTLTFNIVHQYFDHGTYLPTLTLVGNNGATTVIDAPSIVISGSANPPTVSTSFNSTTNILTAIFSEDVGAALVGQVDSNDAALGEPLWTDGASTVNTTGNSNVSYMIPSSFATDLDIRNDNSGANVSLTSTQLDSIFSYSNTAPFTATWNFSGLISSGVINTTSTSYTARLFAAATQDDPGTGIQDQAGNDLDGINSGIGGQDATLHFGSSYPTSTLTLATWNGTATVWNSSLPLVFAPSIQPVAGGPGGSITSIASQTTDTVINFTVNSTNKQILNALTPGVAITGGTVLIEDMPSGLTALDGFWVIDTVTTNSSTCALSIIANSSTLPDSSYATSYPDTANMHISPEGGAAGDNYDAYVYEEELIQALHQITGVATTSIPYTGTDPANGIFVGETSQFNTNTTTDLGGYLKSFDDESQLGFTGYLVESIISSSGSSLYLLGGPNGSGSGENDAIDAFLQSLGMEEYGPIDTKYGSSDPNSDVWQITPNLTTLSGSWDIRQVPSISYLKDTDTNGGALGWSTLYMFNYGGGSPTPTAGAGEGSLTTQANEGFGIANGTDLYNHPDWWASNSNMTLSYGGYGPLNEHDVFAATFMPGGTVNTGDTFSITLTKNNGNAQTITYAASPSDANSLTDLVNDIITNIELPIYQTSSAYSSFFISSSNLAIQSNMDYNTNGLLSLSSSQNPVVEIFEPEDTAPNYTVSCSVSTSSSASFIANVYQNTKLNFANPGVYHNTITNWVTPWAANATPGSILSLSADDGVNYDESAATEAAMHANNNAWQDSNGYWWGYNSNGVLVSGVSESYWTFVNEIAQYILQTYPNQDLLVGGLEYAGTSQPPSFAMEPNAYIELGEFSDNSTDSDDQQFKIDANAGALIGIYKNWGIYYSNTNATAVPNDLLPSALKKDFTTYNNDHVFALEGENNPSYGVEMPGYLIAGLLTDNASTANAVTMQNVLTNYYNSSFGPAAPYMEDYTVLFNGTAADPNLMGPPAQIPFNGTAFAGGGQNAVNSDLTILQQTFGYLDAAQNALTNAFNSGHNTSFPTAQYNADQARVDQIQLYNLFLFDEYKLEYDYYNLHIGGVNSAPAVSSATFTTIINDMYTLVSWVDDLYSTNLVNATNFIPDFQAQFTALSYFYSNDPLGSNGLRNEGFGMLNVPNSSATPNQTKLTTDWTNAETAMAMPPAVPTGLSATATSDITVNLTWTNNDAGTAYDIYRSTASTGTFAQIGTTGGAGVTSYVDATASSAGTSYYYEVATISSATVFSNVASPMAVPSSLNARTASSSQIDLSWIDNDGGSATGYDIDRSTATSGSWTQFTVGPSSTAYYNTGLTDGTTYYYEVAAFDGTTTSSFSSIASAVTTMNAPGSLAAAASTSTSQINLTWTNHDSSIATAYDIDRSTTSTGGFILVGTAGAGATNYSDTGLIQDTQYFYEVDAVGAVTTSFFSNIANAVTILVAPSGLTAAEANGSNRAQQVNLTWTDNDGGAATAYDIDRSTISTGGFAPITPGTVGAGATAYTDTTAFPSTTYYYEVEAVNATTHSAFSSVSSPGVVMPTNQVGGVVTDDWYGTNGSAWSTQWTQTNATTNATPTIKILTTYQGRAKFASSGGAMSGTYLTNINTATFVDSYQSVLVESDTNGSNFELVARSAATTDSTSYLAELTWSTSSSTSNLEIKVAGGGVIGSLSTGMVISTNALYDLEFEVVTANSTTTDLYAKVWNITSATEPTTWQIIATDSTGALQNGNSSNVDGMKFILSNASENTFTVDNYELVNLTSSSASYIDNFQNSSTTGWTPLTASRWSVGTKGNATSGYSVRYYINTSSYAEGSNNSLGEYSLLSASGDTNVGDFTMTVDVAAASTTAGSNYAIVFGYQNSTNYYFMEFNATSGNTALYKVVGGATPVSIGTTTGGQITDTLYHAIKIQRIGASISVWYDGDDILTTSDATFIGGQIGIGALNDAAYFDNVIVG